MSPTALRDTPTPRRCIAFALGIALIGLAGYVGRQESAATAASMGPPAATTLNLDIQGKMLVYASHVPGLQTQTMATAIVDPTPIDEELRADPEVAVRLAALELLRGNSAAACDLLRGVPGDSSLATIAAGIEAEAGSPAAIRAVEESSRLMPVWARRAFRLHLLECAGDAEGLAREQNLIASEALESLLGLVTVGAAMIVVIPLGILLWLVGLPALVVWRLSRPAPLRAELPVPGPEPPAVPMPLPVEPAPPPVPTLLTAGEVLVAFFAAQLLAGLGYRAMVPEGDMSPLALFAIYIAAGLAAWAVARLRLGPGALAVAGFRRCPVWKLYVYPVVTALALPPVYLLLSLVITQLLGQAPQSSNPALSMMTDPGGWLGRLTILVTVAGAAPLVEEGMFRGVLYAALRNRMGALGAIALSSVLFGLVHLDPLVAPMLILVGVATAILRELTGSVWPSVILHALGNGGAALMVFLLTA